MSYNIVPLHSIKKAEMALQNKSVKRKWIFTCSRSGVEFNCGHVLDALATPAKIIDQHMAT